MKSFNKNKCLKLESKQLHNISQRKLIKQKTVYACTSRKPVVACNIINMYAYLHI